MTAEMPAYAGCRRATETDAIDIIDGWFTPYLADIVSPRLRRHAIRHDIYAIVTPRHADTCHIIAAYAIISLLIRHY